MPLRADWGDRGGAGESETWPTRNVVVLELHHHRHLDLIETQRDGGVEADDLGDIVLVPAVGPVGIGRVGPKANTCVRFESEPWFVFANSRKNSACVAPSAPARSCSASTDHGRMPSRDCCSHASVAASMWRRVMLSSRVTGPAPAPRVPLRPWRPGERKREASQARRGPRRRGLSARGPARALRSAVRCCSVMVTAPLRRGCSASHG